LVPTESPCKGRTDDLLRYLEGALAAPKRAELEQHLADCAACRGTLETAKGLQREGLLPESASKSMFLGAYEEEDREVAGAFEEDGGLARALTRVYARLSTEQRPLFWLGLIAALVLLIVLSRP
jgi:anti-sigma factor RsiW